MALFSRVPSLSQNLPFLKQRASSGLLHRFSIDKPPHIGNAHGPADKI